MRLPEDYDVDKVRSCRDCAAIEMLAIEMERFAPPCKRRRLLCPRVRAPPRRRSVSAAPSARPPCPPGAVPLFAQEWNAYAVRERPLGYRMGYFFVNEGRYIQAGAFCGGSEAAPTNRDEWLIFLAALPDSTVYDTVKRCTPITKRERIGKPGLLRIACSPRARPAGATLCGRALPAMHAMQWAGSRGLPTGARSTTRPSSPRVWSCWVTPPCR